LKRSTSIFRGLKRLLTSEKNNWKVVALCVVGATTFWFFNALNKDYATRMNYPVEFVFDEEGVVVVEELPEKVSIVISGGGWNLLRKTVWFNISPIQVLLENPTSTHFITKASLTSIIADQISEVRLNYVVTDTLYLSIEPEETKKVALTIDSAGISLENNFRVVSPISIEPDSAVFTGPASFIRELADSILLYVPYKQLNRNFSDALDLSQLESQKIQVEPDEIQVSFEVARFSRVNKLVPVRQLNFPTDSTVFLTDTTGVISFTVREDQLQKAGEARFELVADFMNRNRQDSTVALRLIEYPPFIKEVTLETESVPLEYEDDSNRD
jgi:hypothetical protein